MIDPSGILFGPEHADWIAIKRSGLCGRLVVIGEHQLHSSHDPLGMPMGSVLVMGLVSFTGELDHRAMASDFGSRAIMFRDGFHQPNGAISALPVNGISRVLSIEQVREIRLEILERLRRYRFRDPRKLRSIEALVELEEFRLPLTAWAMGAVSDVLLASGRAVYADLIYAWIFRISPVTVRKLLGSR